MLTIKQWDGYCSKAEQQIKRFAKDPTLDSKARIRPYFNNKFNIKAGTVLSKEHVLSIIIYTDDDDPQQSMKAAFRQNQHEYQHFKNIAKEFAHWLRYI